MSARTAERQVAFRFRPGGADAGATAVDLRGDMHHWLAPVRMQPAGDGWLEASMRLPVGVYEYKLQLPGDRWLLDPRAPRTRGRGGVTNSVVAVGGTPEPILHAPARPWVCADDDGRVRVRAALRRGAGEGLALRWDEGGGRATTAMSCVGREDQHDLYEACVPGAGTHLEYLFVTAAGDAVGAPGGAGQAFRVPVAALRPDTPAWWRDAVVYSIFVDRFRRGAGAAWPDPAACGREVRAGGDLDGVTAALPYLAELGVTALHLTPICAAPSPHRYDCVDPRRVDPELGGDAAFARLLDAAHRRGLRVLVDVTVTHVHRDFFAFRDVRARGEASPYWDWFHVDRWPFFDGPDPGYAHYQKGQWREPLLDTGHPDVAEYLVETFRVWARRGADGFRIDAASDVPRALVARIRRAVRRIAPGAVVFGELIPDNTERWTDGAVDAATDFAVQRPLHGWLWTRDAGRARIAAVAAERRFRRGGPGWTSLAFTGTHDQPRLGTLAGAGAARLGQLFVLLRASVPVIYYGDEVGLAAADATAATRAFEDSWPDRQPMPWDARAWNEATLDVCRRAIALRRRRDVLRGGDESYPAIDAPDEVVCLRRDRGDEMIDAVLNGGDDPQLVPLPDAARPARLLLDAGDARLVTTARGPAVELGPWSAAVLDRSSSRADDPEILDGTRELAAIAHREGYLETPVYPASVYVTVTETCNLRCRHCITGAPDKTRAGRARELRPWVLDALGGAFAAADYVAFTHGGESLVSPMLWRTLEAIRRARGGRLTDVHLATNGMLLTAERTARLIDAGVTSVMVSIDGASAATNDAIRAGSRLPTVLDHVAAAVELRARRSAEIRVGISTVVGKRNAAELPALGALALDLGVDWLKVEETYPATPFARADLLGPGSAEIRDAMLALRRRVEGTGLVLVDHLDPPAGCTCCGAPSAELRAFRAADDFANRTTFRPCRAAWEIACVDPDGTVHAVDYAHPPLGSLKDRGFFDLWNGEVAQILRARALDDRARRAG